MSKAREPNDRGQDKDIVSGKGKVEWSIKGLMKEERLDETRE